VVVRKPSRRKRHDPFEILSAVVIVFGMLLIAVSLVVYLTTGRPPNGSIIQAGTIMAMGGGLKTLASSMLDRYSEYRLPPEELPGPEREREEHEPDRRK
jgi:hypothetical protein